MSKLSPLLDPAGLPALANRLTDALGSQKRDQLDALSEKLSAQWREELATLPKELALLIQRRSTDQLLVHAHTLGQRAFARYLANKAAERRPDPAFEKAFADPIYQRYMAVLLEGDYSNVELSDRLGQRPETVSRTLRAMRDAGLADHQRQGVFVRNFLTPAAVDLLVHQRDLKRSVDMGESAIKPAVLQDPDFIKEVIRQVAAPAETEAREDPRPQQRVQVQQMLTVARYPLPTTLQSIPNFAPRLAA